IQRRGRSAPAGAARTPQRSRRASSRVLSGRPGLEDADQHEHASEIVDAPLADDLVALQFIEEYSRNAEVLAAGGQSHQPSEVGALDREDLRYMVAVDDQGFGGARMVRERAKDVL